MSVNFQPSKKQWEAWEYLTDNTTTELGYGGAASGGKSYLGCVWIVTMAIAYPDTGWLIGRKELTNLKRTTKLTLHKVFKDFGISEKTYQDNGQNNILTFENGSQIFFLDLDYKPSDPLYTRLGGLEITGAFVDESNEIDLEGIEILKTRIGRRKNEEYNLTPKILETFNPDKGHVYKRYYKPWKDGQLPEHRQFIQALPTDNPYTTKEYIQQLENSDKITRERLLNGNFEYDDDPSYLIDTDAMYDLFTNTVDRGNKFISADIARYGQDSTVIGVWDGYWLIDVLRLSQSSTEETAERIKRLAADNKVPYSRIIIDEDGIGGGVLDLLKGAKGFIANSVPFDIYDPRSHSRKPANFRNLKSQCYFKLAEMINQHRLRIDIDDNHLKEMIIEELQQVRQKDMDKDTKLAIIPKDEVKKDLGRSPDISDMLMMRMYFEYDVPSVIDVKARRAQSILRRRNYKNNAY